MPAAVAVPLIMGGISAGATIYAANKQSNAVNQATQTQTAAGQHAIDVQAGLSREGLDFAKQQWAAQQQNMAPWLQYGGGALKTLGGLMGISPDMSLGTGGGGGTGGGYTTSPGPTGSNGLPTYSLNVPPPNVTQPGPNDPNVNRTAPAPGNRGGGGPVNRPATTLGAMYPPSAGGPPAVMPPPSAVAPPPAVAASQPPTTANKRGDVKRIRWDDGTEQVVAATDLYKYVQLGAQEVTA